MTLVINMYDFSQDCLDIIFANLLVAVFLKDFMKSQVLLGCLVLGTGLLTSFPSATAQPAPLFQPLINDIRNELPKGWSIRLPSYFPTYPTKLYPYIQSDSKGFRVNFAIKPNCSAPNCTIGGLAMLKSDGKKFPPKGDNLTPINLSNGIRGYYFTLGSGRDKARYVYWEQDKDKFGIGGIAEVVSQKELIDIANSMANEPPITSTP